MKLKVGGLHVNRDPGMCRFGEYCDQEAERGIAEDRPLFCPTHWERLMRIKGAPGRFGRGAISGSKGVTLDWEGND